MEIIDYIIKNGVAENSLKRKARQEKLASKVLACPKCGQTKIYVYEVIESISAHYVDNGVWKHEYDNNEYSNGLYTECRCDNCDHRWRSKRGIDFYRYYLSEED